MKHNIKKKFVLLAVITLTIISVILLYAFRMEIYKSFVITVETAPIGSMVIDEKIYDITVQSKYINRKEDGGTYIILAKQRTTFWYKSNYCYFTDVNVIAENDTHSALEIIGDYKIGDQIIILYDGNLTHGHDIYINKD